MALIGLAALSATANRGDRKTEQPSSVPGAKAELSGRVVEARAGVPINGAVLTIEHAGGRLSVRTDRDGRYKAVLDTSQPVALTADAGPPGGSGLRPALPP